MVIQSGVVTAAVAAAVGLGFLLYYLYESATQTRPQSQGYGTSCASSYRDNIYNSQSQNGNIRKRNNKGASVETGSSNQDSVGTPEECLEEKCSICQEVLPAKVMKLPCDHSFHGGCITKWIYDNPFCPNCRESIN